jgi:hypothetical protein
MAIVYPVYHRNKITKKKVTIATIIITSFNTTLTVLSFFFYDIIDAYVIIAFPLYTILVAAAYIKIFLVASRKSRVLTNMDEDNTSSSERKKKRIIVKNFKLAKTCLLVVVCYFIAIVPGPLSYVLLKDMVNWQLQNMFTIWATTSVFLNSVLNISIFFWKNSMLRHEARKTLQRISCLSILCRLVTPCIGEHQSSVLPESQTEQIQQNDI